jgi:hypothetical protein
MIDPISRSWFSPELARRSEVRSSAHAKQCFALAMLEMLKSTTVARNATIA